MSGGHFDYKQSYIEMIADEVDHLIISNGKLTGRDNECFREYSEETIEEFKKAKQILRAAYVFAQRIDWLVSGDDAEDTFHDRLKDDLHKLYIKTLDISK
jgi:hypothetical protein